MFSLETPKPNVIIDDKLDNTIEDLVFDYDAFYDMCRNAGLSQTDVLSLTFLYTAKKHKSKAGEYRHKPRLATIYVPHHISPIRKEYKRYSAHYTRALSRLASDELNDTTIHETGHHVDWITGETPHIFKRRLRTALSACAIGGAAGFIAAPWARTVQAATGVVVAAQVYKDLWPDTARAEAAAQSFEATNSSRYHITQLRLWSSILDTYTE